MTPPRPSTWRPARQTCDRERGSASLWVVTGGLLVLVVAMVGVVRGTAVIARERAEAAADLAALAGADGIGVDATTGQLCARAESIARANNTRVVACTARLGADGRTGTLDVTVAASVRLAIVGSVVVRAQARAGRLPWQASDSMGEVCSAECRPDLRLWHDWSAADHGSVRALGPRQWAHLCDLRGETAVNLSLSTEDVDGRRVVSVRGEVDVYSAPTLRKCLQDSMDEEHRDLIVDLSAIAFIDSTGLGVLVAGQNRAGELGGALSVVCAQERVLKLFRITGLDEVFGMYPTRDEALAAVQ